MVVLFKIDALRHDFINKQNTPFIASLRSKSIYGKIREPLGFQQHAATFAGLYPESSDIAFLYQYAPDRSPFHYVKYLPLPTKLPKWMECLIRKVITRFSNALENRNGQRAFSMTTSRIPLRFLPYFDIVQRLAPWDPDFLRQTTLFDVLRQSCLQWLYIGYPVSDQHTHAILKTFREKISSDISFVYIHPAEVDWAQHKYGPRSPECKEALRRVDKLVEQICSTLNSMFQKVDIIISGDHGASDVTHTLDIQSRLYQLGLVPTQDYLYFLDSTFARFWFFNRTAEERVKSILHNIPHGAILARSDLRKYRSDFAHNRFGELLFAVKEGFVILPNFFQGCDPIRGMHGYLPDVADNMAFWLIYSEDLSDVRESPRVYDMPDLFPTILDIMGLMIPASCEGRSILEAEGIVLRDR